MNIYVIALFAHVIGAIGAFIGVSVWLFSAEALRRARTVEQVRILTSLIQPSGVVAIVSILLLGVAGLYMAVTVWGAPAAWIAVATICFLFLAPLGVFVIDPRLRAIARAAAAAPDGLPPATLIARTHDPFVGIGLYTYVGVLLGIVYLMTTKPTLATSILAMVIAAALGLAAGVLRWRMSRSAVREKRDMGNLAT